MGDLEELYEVQSPFASFVLRDEGLRLTKTLGQLSLRQITLLPVVGKQFVEASVLCCEDGRAQGQICLACQ